MKSAKRSKSASETTRDRKDKKKFKRSWKKSKVTRNISSIESVKKRILIPKVKNKDGEAVKTRQGIANVFAKFYEDLYEGEEGHTEEDMDSLTADDKSVPSQHSSIPVLTKNDIQDAIDRLKKREGERQQWNTS